MGSSIVMILIGVGYSQTTNPRNKSLSVPSFDMKFLLFSMLVTLRNMCGATHSSLPHHVFARRLLMSNGIPLRRTSWLLLPLEEIFCDKKWKCNSDVLQPANSKRRCSATYLSVVKRTRPQSDKSCLGLDMRFQSHLQHPDEQRQCPQQNHVTAFSRKQKPFRRCKYFVANVAIPLKTSLLMKITLVPNQALCLHHQQTP